MVSGAADVEAPAEAASAKIANGLVGLLRSGGSADGRWRRRGDEGPSSSPRRRGGGRPSGRDAICHGQGFAEGTAEFYVCSIREAHRARGVELGAVDPAT